MGARGSHPHVLCGNPVSTNKNYELPLAPLVPLARLVSEHGFTTAKIGKWHLAPDARPTHPNEAGWRHYAGSPANLRPVDHGESYYGYRKVVNGQWDWKIEYLTTDETEDAIDCVAAGFDLISVSYHSVHIPFQVPPPDLYTGPPPTTDREIARTMLEAMDHELGRLLDVALPAGYTTLVFADNGTDKTIGGQKGHLTPGGVNVPLWAIGPGVTHGIDRDLVDVADVYATVTDLMGITRDAPAVQGPDSVSFLDRLTGSGGPTRSMIFTDRWMPNGKDPRDGLPPGKPWRRCLRSNGWSLMIDDQGDEGVHFFHYAEDLREEEDLLPAGMDPPARDAYLLLREMLGRL